MNISVSSYALLISKDFARNNGSWVHYEASFATTYKKYLLFVECQGGMSQSIIFTKDELDTICPNHQDGIKPISCGAFWDSTTLAWAKIDNNASKLIADAKSQTLEVYLRLYGMN